MEKRTGSYDLGCRVPMGIRQKQALRDLRDMVGFKWAYGGLY